MNIVWSPLAVDQVRDIACYIALDKVPAAEAWVEDIFACVERLSEYPESGRVVPEISRHEIREIVRGRYRIIYKITAEEIRILLVKSYRQKLKSSEVQ